MTYVVNTVEVFIPDKHVSLVCLLAKYVHGNSINITLEIRVVFHKPPDFVLKGKSFLSMCEAEIWVLNKEPLPQTTDNIMLSVPKPLVLKIICRPKVKKKRTFQISSIFPIFFCIEIKIYLTLIYFLIFFFHLKKMGRKTKVRFFSTNFLVLEKILLSCSF